MLPKTEIFSAQGHQKLPIKEQKSCCICDSPSFPKMLDSRMKATQKILPQKILF